MLQEWFPDMLWLRAFQALSVMCIGMGVVLVLRRVRFIENNHALFALVQGLFQVLGAGAVLMIAFRGPGWFAPMLLPPVVFLAARMASRHAPRIPCVRRVALYSIGAASTITIGLMLLLGVIDPKPSSLLPISSLLIANAMNATSLMLERLQAELVSHAPRIEAALALGASPQVALAPHIQAAARACLLPRIDTLRSLGIIWIPGMMSGMLLAGDDPIQAALYQFVIIALLLIIGALVTIGCGRWLQPHLFTQAEQLRPLATPPPK